jgi:hypothetical protein
MLSALFQEFTQLADAWREPACAQIRGEAA